MLELLYGNLRHSSTLQAVCPISGEAPGFGVTKASMLVGFGVQGLGNPKPCNGLDSRP